MRAVLQTLCCALLWASSAVADDWCVVVATVPYSALASAQDGAAAAKAAGLEGAAVYDTREFTTLDWGELVVVALQGATKEQATAAAKTLKTAKLTSSVRRCASDTVPTPIRGPEDLAALPALPQTPVVLAEGQELDYGCFAWSDSAASAACVVGALSIQGGAHARVVFPGSATGAIEFVDREPMILDPVPMLPDAARRAAIRRELEAGKYVPLTLEPRKLVPNSELRWASPRMSLNWTRKEIGWEGHPESGEWPVYADRVSVTCSIPGRKGVKPRAKTTVVFATRDAENDEPDIEVYAIPGGRYFVLLYDTSWGIEGNSGGSTRAYRVDGLTCAVVKGR